MSVEGSGRPGRPGGRSRRVVVTGAGVVCAAGVGLEASWRQLACAPPRPTVCAGPPPMEEVRFPAFVAPEYDLAAVGVARRRAEWLRDGSRREARDLHHLAAATALALADARLPLDCELLDPPVGLIVADESPGFEELSRQLLSDNGHAVSPADPMARYTALVDRFFELNTFLLPHYLARTFGLAGLGLFVNSACASGLNAIDIAAQTIRAGRSDVVVVAAADNTVSVAKFLWFRSLGLYAEDGALRPFDARQTGTVFGDGGAALILEDAESAVARGARIYAEYAGGGFSQDGWKVVAPAAAKDRGERALHRALHEAGLQPAAIDLVVTHGIGSPASDQYEARMLHRVFGARPSWPAVAALKPMIGHSLGASALVETALLLGILEHGVVPPAIGYEAPLKHYPVPLAAEWRPLAIDAAVKVTCAFGGFYGAIVLRRFDAASG